MEILPNSLSKMCSSSKTCMLLLCAVWVQDYSTCWISFMPCAGFNVSYVTSVDPESDPGGDLQCRICT